MDLVCCYVRRRASYKCSTDQPSLQSKLISLAKDSESTALVVIRVLGATLHAKSSHGDMACRSLFAEVEWQSRDGSLRQIGRTSAQRMTSGTLDWQYLCAGQPYMDATQPRDAAICEKLVLSLVGETKVPGEPGSHCYGLASFPVEDLLGPDVRASAAGGRGPVTKLALLTQEGQEMGSFAVQATLLFTGPASSDQTTTISETRKTSSRSVSPSSSVGEEEEAAPTPAKLVEASLVRHWSCSSLNHKDKSLQARPPSVSPSRKVIPGIGEQRELHPSLLTSRSWQESAINDDSKDDVGTVPYFCGEPICPEGQAIAKQDIQR